ncbi:CpsD/CapB family tyrosine-protein kinase [bacterium]|nr:CpsD/CapB family tyrosine-protein kinase [bacterium]
MVVNSWAPGPDKSDPPDKERKNKAGASKKTKGEASQSGSYAEKFLSSRSSEEQQRHPEQEGSFKDQFLGGGEKESEYQEKSELKKQVKKSKVQVGELLKKLISKRNSMVEADIPCLSKRAEEQLGSNLKELSVIESNLMGMDRGLTTFYCTSCFSMEGKTTAVVNAAFGLSVYGRRNVLLIDSSSDAPYINRLFGVSNEPGLQGILDNTVSAEEAIIPTGYKQLYLLPAGDGNMSLSDEIFKKNLEMFKKNFDFVLIDGKSLLASSEVSNIASAVDGFLLVVKCEKTKWEVVQLAQEKLRQSGAQHIGIVLNKRKYYVSRAFYRLISKR